MNNFTFLTKEQIFGREQLDIIKEYGTKCAITDFAILLGGKLSNFNYTSEGTLLKDRACSWYTKTLKDCENVSGVSSDGNSLDYVNINERMWAARPALPYSSISMLSSNPVKRNGILEVEYGEYPQTVVLESFSKTLESIYSDNKIKQTGKIYTTDSVDPYIFEEDGIYWYDSSTPFQERTHIEYEYNGRKYIRFVADFNDEELLSDGRVVEKNNPYWIEVEPIKWIIDESADIALSKKSLFSGVQFENKRIYEGDFDKTDIKAFMDRYFSKDIIPSHSKEIKKEKKKLEKRTNPYGFNFNQVSEEDIIRGAVESGVAVFLHGRSSEGKSGRVKQIDPNCVIIYLRNATPESFNGKSVYNSDTGEMKDVKPTWLKKLEDRCEREPNKYHIVFLDEITNALPSIQSMAFNLVLDREVNGIWQLPENARIVAAGNDMEDSLIANKMPEPLFNRFAHVYIETSVESWLKWASEHKIHPAIYAYIAYKKGITLRSEYNGEKPNADPRKWEMASKMLYATGQPEMIRALVGENITREFCQFCNQKVITLEDVLNEEIDLEKTELQMNVAEIYATAMGLSQVDEANFEKVREFVSKLGAEPCAMFESLWAHGDEARIDIVAETRLANSRGGRRV